jgi:tRNA dimethylallyltransferase
MAHKTLIDINTLSRELPILIAGPTASGKSALALEIAESRGGQIVNADALQVYDGWRVLTARPSESDEARVPHALYGHVPFIGTYSTGQWLREMVPLLSNGPRPIILGGTGLNFAALTEGLADIPPTPPAIRAQADALPLAGMLADLDREDPMIAARIDRANRMRVQRAWEVLRSTGRPLSDWQADTPAPALPLAACQPLVLDADPAWLNARIETRFDAMLQSGALQEACAVLPLWDTAKGARKAIGGPELIAHLRGEISLETARDAAIIGSRQYAKRQRTWFRARMGNWQRVSADHG